MESFERLLSDEERTTTIMDNAARALNIALHNLDATSPGTPDYDARKRQFDAAKAKYDEATRAWELALKKLDAHRSKHRNA